MHYFTAIIFVFSRPTPVSSLMAQYGFQEKLFYSKFIDHCQNYNVKSKDV